MAQVPGAVPAYEFVQTLRTVELAQQQGDTFVNTSDATESSPMDGPKELNPFGQPTPDLDPGLNAGRIYY